MWHRHAYACTGCTYTLQAHCKHTASTLQAHCKHCKHAACTLHVHTHVHVHLHVHVCTALGPSSVAACPTAPRSRQPLRSARAALWAREREGPCHGCTPYGDTYYGDTYYGDTYYGYGRHLLWRHLLWLWATLAMATSAGLPYTESYAYRLPPPARTLTLTLTLTLPRPDVRGVVRLLACRVLQKHHRREVRQGVPLRDPLPVRPRGKAPGLEPALMRQDHQRTR